MTQKWTVPLTAVILIALFAWWRTDRVQGQENIPDQATAVLANAGSEITYQGTLQDNGTPANGSYDMVFRLWDAQARGGQVGSDVAIAGVPVHHGQFTVDIDFGHNVYRGQALYLEIGIRNGGSGYETLSPRQPLTGVPLAHSVRPGMIVDNSSGDTSAQLAGPTVGVAGSGNFGGYFSGDTGILAEGIFSDLVLSGDGFFPGAGSISSDPDIANSHLVFTSNDGLFLSLDNNNDGDDGLLTVQNDGATTMMLDGSTLSLHDFSANPRATLSADNNSGALFLRMPNNFMGVVAEANDNGGGGKLSLFNGSASGTVMIDGDQDAGSGGDIVLMNGSNDIIGRFQNDAIEGGGQFDLRDQDGNIQLVLEGQEDVGDGANIIMRNAMGNDTIVFDAQKEGDMGAQIFLLDSTGDPVARLHNDNVAGGGELLLYDSNGNIRIELEAEETFNDGAQMMLYDSSGAATIIIDADHEGTGNGRITTEVLEITGGADLSEQFEVAASVLNPDVAPEPGLVVCIDAANPGQLVVCDRAYDSTVAGIISGAGDVQTGLLMGQTDSVADGRYPVALTGRVYVWAEAGAQPIQPGDLLTTASRTGYAMPAADAHQAFGAILGKAMTGLEAGESGLVLVLVSLQ